MGIGFLFGQNNVTLWHDEHRFAVIITVIFTLNDKNHLQCLRATSHVDKI